MSISRGCCQPKQASIMSISTADTTITEHHEHQPRQVQPKHCQSEHRKHQLRQLSATLPTSRCCHQPKPAKASIMSISRGCHQPKHKPGRASQALPPQAQHKPSIMSISCGNCRPCLCCHQAKHQPRRALRASGAASTKQITAKRSIMSISRGSYHLTRSRNRAS